MARPVIPLGPVDPAILRAVLGWRQPRLRISPTMWPEAWRLGGLVLLVVAASWATLELVLPLGPAP